MSAATMATAPTIELRKFKHAEFASEETNCFEAEVWVNGRPGFHAKNDGRGGYDHYTPISYDDKGRANEEIARAILRAHAASLPPRKHGYGDGAYTVSVETLIGDAVAAKLAEREVDRLVRKMGAAVLTIEGGKLLSRKGQPVAAVAAYLKRTKPDAVVLNTLPESEARAVARFDARHEKADDLLFNCAGFWRDGGTWVVSVRGMIVLESRDFDLVRRFVGDHNARMLEGGAM